MWTVASQAPLSIGFSRQEYWSGLPFPSPGDLLNPGIEPGEVIGPGVKSCFANFRAVHPLCLSKQCAKQATGNGMYERQYLRGLLIYVVGCVAILTF